MDIRWLNLSTSVTLYRKQMQREVVVSIRNNEQLDLLEQYDDLKSYTPDPQTAHYIRFLASEYSGLSYINE